MPCTEKRAWLLLDRHRAVIHKMFPFTIRLKDRTVAASILQPLRIKLDPGSRTTGVATVPRSQYAGVWRGCVLVRASGRFDISADGRRIAQSVPHKYCRVLQREDGWQYAHKHRAV